MVPISGTLQWVATSVCAVWADCELISLNASTFAAHRVEEFYCALGVVARIPPFVERHDRTAAELAWAGAAGPAGEHSPGPASPERKRAKQT